MHRHETRQRVREARESNLTEVAVVLNSMAWSPEASAFESLQVVWSNYMRNSRRVGINTCCYLTENFVIMFSMSQQILSPLT